MARYKDAIAWIAANDDTEWLHGGQISVTATLVADLFGKTDSQVTTDLRAAVARYRASMRSRVHAMTGERGL